MISESARICRDPVLDLEQLHAKNFEALIIPGDFGAIESLAEYAFKGHESSIDAEVKRIIDEFTS